MVSQHRKPQKYRKEGEDSTATEDKVEIEIQLRLRDRVWPPGFSTRHGLEQAVRYKKEKRSVSLLGGMSRYIVRSCANRDKQILTKNFDRLSPAKVCPLFRSSRYPRWPLPTGIDH